MVDRANVLMGVSFPFVFVFVFRFEYWSCLCCFMLVVSVIHFMLGNKGASRCRYLVGLLCAVVGCCWIDVILSNQCFNVPKEGG